MVTLITIGSSWDLYEHMNTIRTEDPNKYQEIRFVFPELKLTSLEEKKNEVYGAASPIMTVTQLELLMNIYEMPPVTIECIVSYPCPKCEPKCRA